MAYSIEAKIKYKILLISINNLWRYSNVGIDQITGYLRNDGYVVDVFYHHKNLRFDEIISSFPSDYNFYGFSINSSNFSCCTKIAEYIKEKQPSATIVFGGGYPTRYYREIYKKCTAIDYITLGDGEIPTQNLLEHILFDAPIIYINNIVVQNEYENKFPYCNGKIDYFPAMDYFETDSRIHNVRKEYCLQTKNNVCTGKCTFCTERKGPIVYKDISHIVDEIDFVHRRFGIKKFFFTDDNILDPNNTYARERISELCDRINKLGHNLVFKCYIKANSLHDIPEDNFLLNKMSNVGFKTIFVGIEAGTDRDLRLYNKFTTVEDNYTILKLLRRYEIAPQIGFINFNPYSTIETIRENYYFLTKIEMDNVFMYICSYLRVYKYTAMYEKIVADGLIVNGCDYLDDKSIYKFADKKVQEIFDFLAKHMLSRVRNLDFEFDWLYSFYLECKKINPFASKYAPEFEELKRIQLEKIKDFFYILFVENDFKKGELAVEEFLSFFEQLQPKFSELHKNLLDLYIK